MRSLVQKGPQPGKGVFTSTYTEWGTPPALFYLLNQIHGFTLDVCANDTNAKCREYFSPEQDGLAQSWAGQTCWMNPPYGRDMHKWIVKAVDESSRAKVVCLLPARTDTKSWHSYVFPLCTGIVFLRGRLRFTMPGDAVTTNAPFPSALVVFDRRAELKKPYFRPTETTDGKHFGHAPVAGADEMATEVLGRDLSQL